MNRLRTLAVTLLPLVAALAVPLSAQRYTARSFEAPAYRLGTLPGQDLWSGQDGWILLGGATSSAQVQGAVVKSGTQAVTWDAAAIGPAGSVGELRRNELFTFGAEVMDVEFDFRLDSSANPSAAWIFISQSFPHPCSELYRWIVRADGEVWMRQGTNCVSTSWQHTGIRLPRDRWLHARTTVDVSGDLVELHIDGALVATSNVTAMSPFPDHGFTQVFCDQSGDDRLHLDNFQVRTRARGALALSVDLETVDSAARTELLFRLHAEVARAGRPYMLLASLAGTSPGTNVGSNLVLPLNADGLTLAMLAPLPTAVFQGFQSRFDPNGAGIARFDSQLALPALAGTTMHFAYVPLAPLDAVSEPVVVRWQ